MALVVLGHYAITNPDTVAPWLEGVLGSRGAAITMFLENVFAHGVAVGIGTYLLGTMLVALAIRSPVEPVADDSGAPAIPSSGTSMRSGYALGALAAMLTAVMAFSLYSPARGTGTVAAWIGSLTAAFLAMLAFDRGRRTGFGNPLPRRWEWPAMALLAGLDLALVAYDLTDWHWGGIPDESFFFAAARDLLQGSLHRFPLAEDGVFGYHPLLSSYYQALFMKLFGVSVFAWRLSSAVALAGSLPFLYLLGRELWSARAGLFAAVLFGSAQLAVGYAHWGYNNTQVYPIILGSLGILAWSLRRRSLAGCYLAGCIAGLGFYTFYPARLAPALAVLLTWSVGGLALRRARREAGALMLGVALAALPALAHPGHMMSHMLEQTALTSGDGKLALGLPSQDMVVKILGHWVLSVLYAVWFKCPSNFGWNPVVDPIVAALSTVGLWLGIGALWRRARVRFVLPAYVFSAFVVGAVSQYYCPPLTRLLTITPFTALLAALTLDQLMRAGSRTPALTRTAWTVGTLLVAAAVLWNVTALHASIYERHHGYGDGTTAELIRITRRLPAGYRIVHIQGNDNDSYNVDQVLHEYGLGARCTCLRPFDARASEALRLLAPPFLVSHMLKNPEERQVVERAVAERFPDAYWQDSAAGQVWNLRYVVVPATVTSDE